MRDLQVVVTPRAKKDQVTCDENGLFRVATTRAASDNQANLAVIALLAKHLHARRSELILIRGEKSRQKVVRLLTD